MMADAIREIKQEIFENQDRIIRLQSEAVNGLLKLLAQHADVDEADFAPIKEKIDEAAMIRAEMEL